MQDFKFTDSDYVTQSILADTSIDNATKLVQLQALPATLENITAILKLMSPELRKATVKASGASSSTSKVDKSLYSDLVTSQVTNCIGFSGEAVYIPRIYHTKNSIGKTVLYAVGASAKSTGVTGHYFESNGKLVLLGASANEKFLAAIHAIGNDMVAAGDFRVMPEWEDDYVRPVTVAGAAKAVDATPIAPRESDAPLFDDDFNAIDTSI